MSRQRTVLHRLRRGHRSVAALLLNTVVLLVLIEAAAGVAFWVKDRNHVEVDFYGVVSDAEMKALYPDQSRADVTQLWGDVLEPLDYQPFTEFQERPRTTTFVNVDPAGFRRSADQGPWPPDPRRVNVFVFGGSTTFGYGVADGDTIPARLQPLLRAREADVSVYNFARGYYYSTQERILFEQLLAAGHVPALAIFIDGLNDFCFEDDTTAVSRRLATALDVTAPRAALADWAKGTAIGRAAAFVQKRVAPPPVEDPAPRELGDDVIQRIIDRYLANKRLIEAASTAYGVVPVFVWQPVPMYRYDPQFHLFAGRGFFGVTQVRHGYEVMADTVRDHPIGGHFVWLADVQASSREALYIDVVHYAPRFAGQLAALIDERIAGLLPHGGGRH